MASLQLRNGSWRILFNCKGKQLTFTVGEVNEIEARAVKGKVEYLFRLEQRLAHPVPPDDRIVEYLQNDGTLPEEGILTKTLPQKKPLTLAGSCSVPAGADGCRATTSAAPHSLLTAIRAALHKIE